MTEYFSTYPLGIWHAKRQHKNIVYMEDSGIFCVRVPQIKEPLPSVILHWLWTRFAFALITHYTTGDVFSDLDTWFKADPGKKGAEYTAYLRAIRSGNRQNRLPDASIVKRLL